MRRMLTLSFVLAAVLTAVAKERVMFVCAHPDDTEGFAATAFLLKDRYELHIVDFTRGDAFLGPDRRKEAAAIREKEEHAACALLGATPHFLAERDGDAYASREATADLMKLVSELKPKAVFTHWPIDRHPDHVQCAATAHHALRKLEFEPEIYYFEVLFNQTRNFHPLYSVDVTATFERKVELLRKYPCQNVADSLVARKRDQARIRGFARVPAVRFAETFTTYYGVPYPGGVLESLKETAVQKIQ